MEVLFNIRHIFVITVALINLIQQKILLQKRWIVLSLLMFYIVSINKIKDYNKSLKNTNKSHI